MRTTWYVSRGVAVGIFAAIAACDAGSPPERVTAWDPKRDADDSGGVLIEALRGDDPYARAERLGALLPTLGPEAASKVEQALRDPARQLGIGEQELLVRFWATHDPERATDWAANRAALLARPAVLMAALPYWVAADLQATLVAVDLWKQWRPDLREAALRGLVRGWYQAAHPGLTEYIRDMPGGLNRQLAINVYLRSAIPKEGVEAVSRWAESVPDDDEAYKLSVYRQIASAFALYNPAAAMRWCAAHCDGPYGNNLRKLIADRWVTHDGPAAFEWLSTAPEGPERKHAIRVTLETWVRQDPDAALAWIERMTGGEGPLDPWFEPIFPVYARLLAPRSPMEAIEWANRIEDGHDREVMLINVARVWRQSDEVAAEAWLQASTLSDEARAKVRDPDERRRGTPGKPRS